MKTQSTHKLLAAFSQASMIHVKGDVNEETFNEAFMMHTSTSPHYGIVASTETAAAMMKGNAGKRLIEGSIDRAIKFRKEIKRLKAEAEGLVLRRMGSRSRLMRKSAGRCVLIAHGTASKISTTSTCTSTRSKSRC
ncbi:Lysine decarboxylase, inducible [Pluralibacter gergoviae]|nr:Lysine decarboxylase, inducible [Pluralibacter gergoviae]